VGTETRRNPLTPLPARTSIGKSGSGSEKLVEVVTAAVGAQAMSDTFVVFRDNTEVMTTQSLKRALVAMDSMFDRAWGSNKPYRARIEKNGEVIETRQDDKSMKMLVDTPPEVHHHAAPHVPRTEPFPPRTPPWIPRRSVTPRG